MAEKRDLSKPSRRSIRLQEYNYSQPGMYFVTIVTRQRRGLLGEVVDGKVQLNSAGNIVSEMWHGLSDRFANVSVDAFVVMPNHLHGIVNVGAEFIAPDPVSSNPEGAMNRAPTIGKRSAPIAPSHLERSGVGAQFIAPVQGQDR